MYTLKLFSKQKSTFQLEFKLLYPLPQSLKETVLKTVTVQRTAAIEFYLWQLSVDAHKNSVEILYILYVAVNERSANNFRRAINPVNYRESVNITFVDKTLNV